MNYLLKPVELGLVHCVQHWGATDVGTLALSTLEAGLKRNLWRLDGRANEYPKIGSLDKTQTIFSLINFVFCVNELKTLYDLFYDNATTSLIPSNTLLPIVVALGTIALPILYRNNALKLTQEELLNGIPEERRQVINVSLKNYAFDQYRTQLLYLTRALSNLALTALSPDGTGMHAIKAAMVAYNLWRLPHIEELQVAKRIRAENMPMGIPQQILEVECKYNLSFLRSKTSQECGICQSEDNRTVAYFCDRHVYHIPCILRSFYERIIQVVPQNAEITTVLDHNNRPTTVIATDVNESDLPQCPMCSMEFPLGRLDFSFLMTNSARLGSRVNVLSSRVKPSSLASILSTKPFEVFSLVHGAFQAGVSSIQMNHFEIMESIRNVQGKLSFLEFPLLCRDVLCFINEMKPKRRFSTWKENVLLGTKIVLTGLVAATSVAALNAFFRPKIIPDLPAGLDAQWTHPNYEFFIQCFTAIRLLFNLQMGLKGENRKYRLANAAIQALSVINQAQIPWLTVKMQKEVKGWKRSVEWPFDHISYDVNATVNFIMSKQGSIRECSREYLNAIRSFTLNLFNDAGKECFINPACFFSNVPKKIVNPLASCNQYPFFAHIDGGYVKSM